MSRSVVAVVVCGWLVVETYAKFVDLCVKIKLHTSYTNVRGGIRTHAYHSRLQPECSALDHSAILTHVHALPPLQFSIHTQTSISLKM